MLDTLYLHGGFDQPPNAVQRRFSDGNADAWGARVDRLTVPQAVHKYHPNIPLANLGDAAWLRAELKKHGEPDVLQAGGGGEAGGEIGEGLHRAHQGKAAMGWLSP